MSEKLAQSSRCPSVEELAHLLEPLTDPSPEITAHLERCESCRILLDGMAGDSEHWSATATSLKDTQYVEHRHQATLHIVNSICALSQGVEAKSDALREHEVEQLTQLLEPASHPELLGKLGRYEFEQLIGRGGMGLVFRAFDIDLHRVVAIKTLAIHLVPIAAARERFIREGRAAASLVHPHVVAIHDVITDGPVPALVMQLVSGLTLEEWLMKRGPMAWRQATELMLQVLSGLSAAHEKGFVHRDIKPGNVLLEAEASRALLSDFGLVRALDDATLTHSGTLAGTPDYMSPEQAKGGSVENTSDLFSMGALFYAMLCGHPPFRAAAPMAVLNRICNEPHRPLTDIDPDVPLEIAKFVDRLLHKDPRRRFASADEARTILEQINRSKVTLLPLQQQKHRKRLGVVAVLALAVVAYAGLPLWFAPVKREQRAQFESSSTKQSAAEVRDDFEPVPIDDTTMESSFVVLEKIDRELVRIHRQLDQLLPSQSAVSSSEPLAVPSLQTTDVWRQLNRLERELRQESSASLEQGGSD